MIHSGAFQFPLIFWLQNNNTYCIRHWLPKDSLLWNRCGSGVLSWNSVAGVQITRPGSQCEHESVVGCLCAAAAKWRSKETWAWKRAWSWWPRNPWIPWHVVKGYAGLGCVVMCGPHFCSVLWVLKFAATVGCPETIGLRTSVNWWTALRSHFTALTIATLGPRSQSQHSSTHGVKPSRLLFGKATSEEENGRNFVALSHRHCQGSGSFIEFVETQLTQCNDTCSSCFWVSVVSHNKQIAKHLIIPLLVYNLWLWKPSCREAIWLTHGHDHLRFSDSSHVYWIIWMCTN